MSGRGKPVYPPVANTSLDLNGAQFSVLNSMRTGNVVLDMIIALLVPFFFKLIFSDSKQLLTKIYDFFFVRKPSEDECIREISFLSVGSSLTGRDHKNQLLQKAITLYLTEEVRLPFKDKAQVSLTAFHDTSVGMGPVDKYNPLARYRLTWQAPENFWVQIEPGLQFQQRTMREGADEDEDDQGHLRPIQREMVVFELKTSKKDGPQQIDRFIERALSWYKQELLKMRDDARYMYTMISTPSVNIVSEMASTKRGATGGDKGGMPYKRYKLSDQKTFKSLFFPEKESILKLLSDFQQKAGKYGVEGYPHKLGLLLHGPPGTGKTSLIKALAQHTGRSIINIPLARISTNQQLMDVMHDLRISVPGQDMAVPLTFKDVIFVIEDIDAASSVVHRREHEGSHLRLRKATVETTRSMPSSGFLTEKVTREMSTASDDEEASVALKQGNGAQCCPMAADAVAEKAGTVPSPAAQPALTSPPSLAPQAAMEADRNLSHPPTAIPSRHVPSTMEHLLATGVPSMPTEAGAKEATKSSLLAKLLSEEDELNLAGLLNVLDGVVDTPERMLIMTSNHPERLDPALIRPGRIDKKIFLGFLQHAECKQMLAHYFAVEVSTEQDARIRMLLGGANGLMMTPADMEQLCAEHSTVDDILETLAVRCTPPMLVPSRSKH